MQTECSAERFDFGTVEGRAVEAAFDAGLVTSDAGALLLGATDRAIRMMDRLRRASTTRGGGHFGPAPHGPFEPLQRRSRWALKIGPAR